MRNVVVLNWRLWTCKEEAKAYIHEMLGLDLPVRVNCISDSEWESLSTVFGDLIERGVA